LGQPAQMGFPWEGMPGLVQDPQGDFMEIRAEEIRSQIISCAGGIISDFGLFGRRGIHVRVLRDGVWGRASSSGTSGAGEAASRAALMSRAAGGRGRASLPAFVPAVDSFRKPPVEAFASVPDREKAFLCRRYWELLSASSGAGDCRVTYAEHSRDRRIINSVGTDVAEDESICGFRFEIPGPAGSVFRDLAGRSGFEFFRGREKLIEEVCSEYAGAGTLEPVQESSCRIILDPELTGVFVHEVFGHLCEADAHPFTPALDGMLAEGRKIASTSVSIIDDSTHFDLPGSCAFDDEGMPGGRKVLISGGRMKSRLHSLETAAAAGVGPTGNGRAGDFAHGPAARMTCTFMMPGENTLDDLLALMSDGLLLQGAISGSTNMDSFRLSARKAWRVSSGRPGRIVGPCTITGRVFDLLGSIEAASGDLALFSGTGGCSKPGHLTLPVSYGGPHVLLGAVRVRAGA
jgi:TldD protein